MEICAPSFLSDMIPLPVITFELYFTSNNSNNMNNRGKLSSLENPHICFGNSQILFGTGFKIKEHNKLGNGT